MFLVNNSFLKLKYKYWLVLKLKVYLYGKELSYYLLFYIGS